MKVMILGLGKSGTTALLYKLAAGLPGCEAFSGGRPGKYNGDYSNAIYKHTYEERKGKDFDLYREHLKKEHYDRKIWIARDPRDVAVSRMLYRWNRGCVGRRRQFRAHLDLVLKKEADPRSIPFHEICRYTGRHGWPMDVQEVVNEERVRYRHMHDFVNGLDSDWFLFTYEDMVNKNFAALNDYLGFEVQADRDVPDSTGKAKVVRKKASGDWRHWFTQEDVELFRPAYSPYMQLMGYDDDDWTPSANPVIEPEYSSLYMQSLVQRVPLDTARRLKGQAQRLFSRKVG
ncbi:MAG: hypothetical protein ACE5FQ_12625 [Thiogranum sp.]